MLAINKETHNKHVRTKDYNYNFDYSTGYFERWGKTKEEDPEFSIFGAELADIEITTKCWGGGCAYCYKNNKVDGRNMSFSTFKSLIEKINVNNVLTQVAFGLGASGEENPGLWDMCEYLRSKYIVPNGTVANITDETADKIAKWFGACDVSFHGDKDKCYNSIKKLTDRGLKQVNMHYVIHAGNYESTFDVFSDTQNDERLKGLNAVVILSLKKKGRASTNDLSTLSPVLFNNLVEYLVNHKISFGMDSCSSHKYLNFLKSTKSLTKKEKDRQLKCIEPCESFAIFSSYFNVDGLYYPCSFAEGCFEGIDVFKYENFVRDVWNGKIMKDLRNKSLNCGRKCLLYEI